MKSSGSSSSSSGNKFLENKKLILRRFEWKLPQTSREWERHPQMYGWNREKERKKK